MQNSKLKDFLETNGIGDTPIMATTAAVLGSLVVTAHGMGPLSLSPVAHETTVTAPDGTTRYSIKFVPMSSESLVVVSLRETPNSTVQTTVLAVPSFTDGVSMQRVYDLAVNYSAKQFLEAATPPMQSSSGGQGGGSDRIFAPPRQEAGSSMFGGLRPNPYGESDLAPAGTGLGVPRDGYATGGMMFGSQNPVFHPGGIQPEQSGNPADQFARFDPIFPGGRGGLRGRGTARGRGNTTFPGEPDPDHLRPQNFGH